MKSKHLGKVGIALAGLLALTSSCAAQDKPQAVTQRVNSLNSYDVARESVLQGTVVAYTASSTAPPFGAHVAVRTSAGVVDVHVGNGKLLDLNHLTLQTGDAVQITGENIAFGQSNIFAARIIQKGSQSVTVRSPHGLPLIAISKENAQLEGAR